SMMGVIPLWVAVRTMKSYRLVEALSAFNTFFTSIPHSFPFSYVKSKHYRDNKKEQLTLSLKETK
ncbi:hypothetical protein ABES19_27315, partial [Brevibacillus choshinensis]|uniref:hypothetical protein n=1 Tax=Brevibacillus choshinensis TaxID=54911 RepID=UPI003D198FC1